MVGGGDTSSDITPLVDVEERKSLKPEKEDELSIARTDVLSDEGQAPVGIATNRGAKINQEDAYFIGGRVSVRMTLNGYSGPYEGCFGVFDGHGGDRAARYTAEHVFDRINEVYTQHQDIERAIIDGVQRLDDEFCSIAKRTERLWISRTSTIAEAPNGVACKMGVEDGSTCLVAILRRGMIYVGNVGDSRAIIATKNGKCITLSIDQKPNRKDERDRIVARGGYVTSPPRIAQIMRPIARLLDVPRVNGSLAMSRSIGDISLKNVITSEPEITKHQISNDDRYLIMATDGLWDMISSKSAAKMASKYADPQRAAAALLQYALSQKVQDNITVLVADVSAYK